MNPSRAGLFPTSLALLGSVLLACRGSNDPVEPQYAPHASGEGGGGALPPRPEGAAGEANASGGGAGLDPEVRCEWARGFANRTAGGRGGRIIRVTSLNTGGEGSLYQALAATGPRIIVFEVGGVIDLKEATLAINSPYVTVAGQTAPSPGITLIRGSVRISTHDVVIQHIAFRPGEAGNEKQSGWEPDALSSYGGAYNIVVDHVSATWGVDENLSASGERFLGQDADDWRENTSHDVTFSHNLVAEALYDSTHSKGPHSKGSLIHDNVTGALIYGSMYVSNVERNPLFKGGARGVVANNLVVNPMLHLMRYNLSATEWAGHEHEVGEMSIVGNDLRYGSDTEADVPFLTVTGVGEVEVFFEDNEGVDLDGEAIPWIGGEAAGLALEQDEPPTWPDDFQAMPVSEVEAYVVANAGSRPWDRDPIDQRIIDGALNGEAAIIDSEQEVGGYPEREATQETFDPDEWDLDCMERL